MAYTDLREFMAALEEAGELVAVEAEVDWNLEIGAILRRIYEIGAPAAHFKKIRGYPEGFTLAGALVGRGRQGTWSKLAVALNLPPDTPYKALLQEFQLRISSPIKPYQVATGPCKENIILEKEVNLFKFPAPYLHEGDGGRYIGTWHLVATKDPDSQWTNWGCYRQMVHTKNRMGGLVWPHQHIGMMYYPKYEARGEPMPFAIAIGTDPCCTIVGAMPFPAGINEADMAGGLRREPVQLVKCETNDLLVPASSEIIIEGVIMPKERWDEGPFGEFSGYRASPRMPRPVYRVECITHRDNPILTASCMGVPIDEAHLVSHGLGDLSIALQVLKKAGVPIKAAYIPPEFVGFLYIVAVAKGYAGIAQEVVSALHASKGGFRALYTIICDDDVDPTDLPSVFHAFFTKCNPDEGIQIRNFSVGWALVPFLDLHDRQFAKGCSVSFDCSWPVDWDPFKEVPQKVSFEKMYPEEIKEGVLNNWSKVYSLPEEGGRWRF